MFAFEKFKEHQEFLKKRGWEITFDIQSNGGHIIHIQNDEIRFVSPVYPARKFNLDLLFISPKEGSEDVFIQKLDFNRIAFIMRHSDEITKEFIETILKEDK